MFPESTTFSAAAAGFGLGLALASAPGPVQAVLLSETLRGGGITRGLRAMAGSILTFASLLLALALGLSLAPPAGLALRGLEAVGGAFLLWLAVDAFRSAHINQAVADARPSLPPALRGVLAVALNPAGWLFLGVVAAPLFASATKTGGTAAAVVTAITLVMGLAVGDGTVVLLGGLGIRRAHDRLRVWVRRALAVVLAVLAVSLVASGVIGQGPGSG